MKDEKFTSISDAELIKKERSLKALTAVLGGAIAVLFVANIFLAFKKGLSALSFMPVALLPVLILNIGSIKAIKKEIKERNLS